MERGLGWISGRITRIEEGPGVKVPHIGWSEVTCPRPSRLFAEHQAAHRILLRPFILRAEQRRGGERSLRRLALMAYRSSRRFERDNIFATQFHPEKSQLAGMKLLRHSWRCESRCRSIA